MKTVELTTSQQIEIRAALAVNKNRLIDEMEKIQSRLWNKNNDQETRKRYLQVVGEYRRRLTDIDAAFEAC